MLLKFIKSAEHANGSFSNLGTSVLRETAGLIIIPYEMKTTQNVDLAPFLINNRQINLPIIVSLHLIHTNSSSSIKG